ncbi:MAG: hypothetical protein Tsb0013_23000 [Phycisphaerales bacterium]
MPPSIRALFMLVLTLGALVLTACGAHQVRGVVRVGENSYVQVVDKDDPRLAEGEPVVGATVTSVVDPQSLGSTRLPAIATDHTGAFAIPVDLFGAGWMEYELGVTVRRTKFSPAEGFFRLPGSDKRLLVVLAPGRDVLSGNASAYDGGYSYERDLERFAH